MERVQIIGQRSETDCGASVLAMLLEMSYEDVYVAISEIDKHRTRHGLYVKQIQTVARRLGRPLLRLRRYDSEKSTGILHVFLRGPRKNHVVLLWGGRVIDTDGDLYISVSTYCALHRATPRNLLVLAE